MVRLLITRQDLEFLILAVTDEKRQSEAVRVPLCRSELACLRKLYLARERSRPLSPGATDYYLGELAKAQSFEGMAEGFVTRYEAMRRAEATQGDGLE